MIPAKRIHTVEEYYFSKKLREVRGLIAAGKPIINLGIGSPDLQPPTVVVDALEASLHDDTAHKYQSYQGIPELRNAIADFYQKNYNVALNANDEVLPLMGSKEGIMHISMVYLDEGDEVLIANPSYPTYTSVTKLLGAIPKYYNLKAANNWLPDLAQLEQQDLSKVKLMWVNYPHMPTGAKATKAFFENLIVFAKKHQILIINDNPYSFILNEEPLSILAIDGAKDVALELNSLSKSFNMAGWRTGMVMGKAEHIQHVLKVKSNMDSGMFYGIQKGAIQALASSKEWFATLNKIYEKRRKLVWELATKLNCVYDEETAGMFVWAKLPATNELTSEEFIDKLLYEKDVFITPGSIFGTQGEGYVRFSLCVTEAKIKEVINRM
ncbi:aminotransferase class I/II-fold pyridoxal phosphate-dependent enzyme [Kordia sp. YSTF-M3]|uniref:Aminotransferase class I/II-fold pyridoxal phosphate-dependent enzyme n=1 Tax=Kordia aestuariivivens TaxID=2759037 RepID=A0ABR7Q4K8_9FLAO|nr:aminotransferase class I/II-fold pyridoxal phosphate-dependent enzyme [Kordia aestuariivivens]MBC8753289.1 aminotransferase class I/II-fold pyridoxal phosphate-dependent enzyme [Kordia aestuariivivens]